MERHEEITQMQRSLEYLITERRGCIKNQSKRNFLGRKIHGLQIRYHEITGRYYHAGMCQKIDNDGVTTS